MRGCGLAGSPHHGSYVRVYIVPYLTYDEEDSRQTIDLKGPIG